MTIKKTPFISLLLLFIFLAMDAFSQQEVWFVSEAKGGLMRQKFKKRFENRRRTYFMKIIADDLRDLMQQHPNDTAIIYLAKYTTGERVDGGKKNRTTFLLKFKPDPVKSPTTNKYLDGYIDLGKYGSAKLCPPPDN